MDKNEDIKFNLNQFRRHHVSYVYLIRIAIYILLFVIITYLIRWKLSELDVHKHLPEDVEIELVE